MIHPGSGLIIKKKAILIQNLQMLENSSMMKPYAIDQYGVLYVDGIMNYLSDMIKSLNLSPFRKTSSILSKDTSWKVAVMTT